MGALRSSVCLACLPWSGSMDGAESRQALGRLGQILKAEVFVRCLRKLLNVVVVGLAGGDKQQLGRD